MNSIQKLHRALGTFLQTTYQLTPDIINRISFTINADTQRQQFGDLSCNAALILAKIVQRSPQNIAQWVIEHFKDPAVAQITCAGGFINIALTRQAYVTLIQELAEQQEKFFKPDDLHTHTYNVEFVSANPTGPLHIGHGRGGIIGDVLGNVLTFIGHQVTKEFYINDAGSQIDKLGQSFKARCFTLLGTDTPLPEDGYQGEYLVTLAQAGVKEYGTDILTKPESFFKEYAKDALLKQLQQTLSNYGITFDVWFSEISLHQDNKIETAIERLKKQELAYEHEGALWFKSTAFGDDKDRVLRKSDGQWTYVASDMAYMLDKTQRGAQQMVMVLGQDHHGYVERLHGLHKALGLEKYPLTIILYQLVSLKEDGQEFRMSKRAGRIVGLQDIIDTVGCDVARFFYLNRKADAHLDFDLSLALKKTDENPVYYLQYAYVRINSIVAKAAEHKELDSITSTDAQALTEHERLLIKKILTLNELLLSISNTHQVHQISYYALELAQLFHAYYAKNKVIDMTQPAQSRARLLVLKQVHMTLDAVLTLLGISRPEKM